MTTTAVPRTGTAKAPAARSRSPLAGAIRKTLKRPSVILALVWVLALIVFSVFATQLAPHDPLAQDLEQIFQFPSAFHWLGTDNLGRDIASRIIYGSQGVLFGAVETGVIALIIAIPLGMVAGYFGRWVDAVVSFYVDALLSLPGFIIQVCVAFVTRNNVWLIMASLGVVFSGALIRLVRGSTQSARNLLYVDSARVSGLSTPRILFRHIFPNVTGPLIVQTFLFLSQALLILTSLSFLGLGFDPQNPDWGQLVLQATQQIQRHPWMMVPIGAVLIITVMAFNQIGTALRASLPQAQRESLLVATKRRVPPAPRNVSTPIGEDLGSASGPPKADLAIDVRELTVSFPGTAGETAVVDSLTLQVQRGQVVGLVGESGCGKSMTSLAIIGLVPPPGGVAAQSISLLGDDLSTMSERERAKLRGRRIAMIGQEPMVALDPCFTAGSALCEALRGNTGMKRADAKKRAMELLQRVGIARPEQVYRSYPHQLSGGMAQRVAIALALTGDPEILIADEPTTALDVTIQAEILDLLMDIRDERGMTILLVTHDLGVVADVCDEVAVMYAGQIIESGAGREILSAPKHPYTQGLLGAVPNLGALAERLPDIPGRVPLPKDWPVGCRFYERCSIHQDGCMAAAVTLAPSGPRLLRCFVMAQRAEAAVQIDAQEAQA